MPRFPSASVASVVANLVAAPDEVRQWPVVTRRLLLRLRLRRVLVVGIAVAAVLRGIHSPVDRLPVLSGRTS